MTGWRRWQDGATIALGIAMLASPFYFGIALDGNTAWAAYVLGAILVLSGLWTVFTEKPAASFEIIPVIAGIALVAAPWAIGFSDVTGMAWTSWIVGALAIVNGLGEMVLLTRAAEPI